MQVVLLIRVKAATDVMHCAVAYDFRPVLRFRVEFACFLFRLKSLVIRAPVDVSQLFSHKVSEVAVFQVEVGVAMRASMYHVALL